MRCCCCCCYCCWWFYLLFSATWWTVLTRVPWNLNLIGFWSSRLAVCSLWFNLKFESSRTARLLPAEENNEQKLSSKNLNPPWIRWIKFFRSIFTEYNRSACRAMCGCLWRLTIPCVAGWSSNVSLFQHSLKCRCCTGVKRKPSGKVWISLKLVLHDLFSCRVNKSTLVG